MKKAVNVRLNEQTIEILKKLSHDLETTKTDIIEQSIRQYYMQNTDEQNDLLRFAGMLDRTQADAMVADIAADRDSKPFSLDFT